MSCEQPGRRTGFKCETCGLVFSHNIVWTTILKPNFALCTSNAHRAPVQYRHSIANHRCSKKRCSICSQHFDHSSQEVHECFVQRPRINAKNASNTNVLGSSTQISNERRKNTLLMTLVIGFLTLRQSRIVTMGMNMFQFS